MPGKMSRMYYQVSYNMYQVSRVKAGCMEVLCSTNKCMLEEEVIRELEEGEKKSLYTWKPSNYSEFWGRTLAEGKSGKLGTKKPEMKVIIDSLAS